MSVEGVLRLVNDVGDELFPLTKKEVFRKFHNGPRYFDLEDYFPSQMERVVEKLARRGWVEKRQTQAGLKIILTESGKRQVLLYKLEELEPKKGVWDGKWRIVFFDVAEKQRKKRNKLRSYLGKLGFWQMQESVFVSPYDCENEVKYIREVLGIPHGVKLGVLERIENEQDLKKIWKL